MISQFASSLARCADIIALLFILNWLLIAASLWRLKSIRALDSNRNKRPTVTLENIAHSLSKLFIVTLSTAAIARCILNVSNDTGLFAIDVALALGGLTTLAASAPAFLLIVLLSQDKKKSFFLTAGIIAWSVTFSGAGQLAAAALFAGKNPALIINHANILFAPGFATGSVLTAGAWLHHQLTWSLIQSERPRFLLIAKETCVAVAPTLFVITLAASALSFAIQS